MILPLNSTTYRTQLQRPDAKLQAHTPARVMHNGALEFFGGSAAECAASLVFCWNFRAHHKQEMRLKYPALVSRQPQHGAVRLGRVNASPTSPHP